MGHNGTFLWDGNDIMLVDELDDDGNKSPTEKSYDHEGYEYEIEEEEKIRTDDAFEYAEKICMEVNSLEHLQEEIIRNTAAYYLRETGIILMDLFLVAIIGAVIAGIAFLFVAHSYYARHQAPWAHERIESLRDSNSIGEDSETSKSDGTSVNEESDPTSFAKC
jgi:hypothetical protein